MVRWTYEEWLLTQITSRLLGADPERGRLAVRGLRPHEHVELIKNLIRVRGIAVKADFAELAKGLRSVKAERDLLAHGLWLRHPRTRRLHIWRTRGEWRPTPAEPAVSRPIKPEAVRKTARDLRSTYREIDRLIRLTRQLEKNINAALRAAP
jgi:hypothetical protein